MKKLRVVSVTNDKDAWAIGEDNKRHLILNYETFQRGIEIGLWDDSPDILEYRKELDEWAEGSVFLLVKSD